MKKIFLLVLWTLLVLSLVKMGKAGQVPILSTLRAISSPVSAKRPRSEPLRVSEGEAQKVFGLDKNWRPLEYIKNNFEDRGKTVIDHATGLMWQKSGSDEPLRYEEAQGYIKRLNRQQFTGYTNWRLPTVEELISLLEPERQSNNLYINPIFDKTQLYCWSADARSLGSMWVVYFHLGRIYWLRLYILDYVRGVRSWQY